MKDNGECKYGCVVQVMQCISEAFVQNLSILFASVHLYSFIIILARFSLEPVTFKSMLHSSWMFRVLCRVCLAFLSWAAQRDLNWSRRKRFRRHSALWRKLAAHHPAVRLWRRSINSRTVYAEWLIWYHWLICSFIDSYALLIKNILRSCTFRNVQENIYLQKALLSKMKMYKIE